MKVNLGLGAHNSVDWERVAAKRWDDPIETPDDEIIEKVLALGDLAEPLGFDGIWAPEHFGTPYGMTPNPLQMLTYYAARTTTLSLGTMVIVAPWWNPIRLAHQIAYLDILSNGRFNTIGLGRGVAKTEFDAVGVDRNESRQRLDETIDILELAFTKDHFSYDGEIFKIPQMELRPRYRSKDLATRFYGASATGPSLEANAKRGLKPLFVGNKSMEAAGLEVQKMNTFRREVGLPPCQPKNVLFMYCTNDKEAAKRAAVEYVGAANRDVSLQYGFGDPSNFVGVKGYEAYAARSAYGAAPKDGSNDAAATSPGYDESNLLIGPPDVIYDRISKGQKACSFEEIVILPNFGTMPLDESEASLRLFAKEVLPAVHKLDAPLHPSCLPLPESVAS